MVQYYADSDASGNVIGFYNNDIWDVEKIPATAIEITEEEWRDSISNPGKYMVKNEAYTLAPPTDPAILLADAQAAKMAELSSKIGAKIIAGYQSPIVLASTGIAYFYGTELVDQQNMTAARVWSESNPTKIVQYRPRGSVGRVDHSRTEFVLISDAIFDQVNWYLDQTDVYKPQIYASGITAEQVSAIVITIQDPA